MNRFHRLTAHAFLGLALVAASGAQDAAKAELTRLGYAVDVDGLRRAVRYQDQKLIRLFLAAGLSPDLTDAEGLPLLVVAAGRGHVQTVRALLEAGADVHAHRGEYNETALLAAVKAGRADIVPLLIARGADVNIASTGEGTLAKMVASQGDAVILQALVDGGADLDAADRSGSTPLIAAAGQGHTDVVRVLLRGGAGVNKRSPDGWSALAAAVWQGHLEVVRLLLEAGAQMEGKERAELLAAATEKGHQEIRKLLESASPRPPPARRPK